MDVRFCPRGHTDRSHDERGGCRVPALIGTNRSCWCRLDRQTGFRGEDYYERIAARIRRPLAAIKVALLAIARLSPAYGAVLGRALLRW